MTRDTAKGSTVLALLPPLYDHRRSPLNSLSHCGQNICKSWPDLLASIAANLKDLLNHVSGNPMATVKNSRVAIFSKAEYYKRPLLVATSEECQTRNQYRNAPRFLTARWKSDKEEP